MKTILLLLILILSIPILNSQKYHNFIEPDKNWYIIYYCTHCGGYDHHRKYFFEGDTIIDNKTYTILKAEVFKGYINYPFEPPQGFIYNIGYLREDILNRKVYYYYIKSRQQQCESQEMLLYDFSLSKNETINRLIPCYSLDSCVYSTDTLTQIESHQLINGEYVNNYIFRNSSYMEYIGNYFPLLIDTFYTCIANYDYTFICLKKNNEPVYGDLCNLVNLKEFYKNPISICPNPTSNFLTINNIQEDNFKILIFNSIGNKLLEKEISSNYNSISVQELAFGIYYYMILIDGKVIQNGKFIKNL
jgi:hypothetical protein